MTTSSIASPSRSSSPRTDRTDIADTASSAKRPAPANSQSANDARLDGLPARSSDASQASAAAKRPRIALPGADAKDIATREAALDKVYTAVSAQNQQKHIGNQKRLEAGIRSFLGQASVKADIAAGKDVRDCVAGALDGLLKEAQLSTDVYQPKSGELAGYGRYLLHSHAEAGESFCLQLFAFADGQKTPIHDHPNECASFVLKGNLWERLYSPTETPEGAPVPLAVKDKKNERLQGSMDGFGPTELGIPHSLKNTSGDIALSVHLYRDMDGLSDRQQIAAKTKFERAPKAPQPDAAAAE
ncbi:cysteine dioxygenase [Paracidovorax valerianellae]|uniref:Cysteine dioxygenase type I n=1 Tax=Paracidovorax valerianellae TaxID=187868 RepID=A0A1G6LRP9_9BURK|nr:cysteine dioxygenase family protein [Paracidovorax valerianellae]MDA8446407.1 cysteine dioxygenase family protein [Paracidovorax valerianellae]SDC45920.1 Cysteine dioxygenase type I [Paracidovorax valerianellae]